MKILEARNPLRTIRVSGFFREFNLEKIKEWLECAPNLELLEKEIKEAKAELSRLTHSYDFQRQEGIFGTTPYETAAKQLNLGNAKLAQLQANYRYEKACEIFRVEEARQGALKTAMKTLLS